MIFLLLENLVDVEIDDKETIINKEEPEAVEKEVVKTETASEGEMEDYGKKVQSRIDKLTKKLREAERREQAAVEYAQGVQTKQTELVKTCSSIRYRLCK